MIGLNRRRVMGGKGDEVIMTSTSNPEVLAICYAQGWCASPDFMLKSEAEAVTDIGNAFRGSSIVHFNEFEFFTGVTTLLGANFNGASLLKDITLPTSIEQIGGLAFGYTNLDSFICRSTKLTQLANTYQTFRNSSIKYAYINSSILGGQTAGFPAQHLVLGENVVYFSHSLGAITMLESHEGLKGVGVFAGAVNLTSIDLPSTVQELYGEGFRNCAALTSLTARNPIPFSINNYTFVRTNPDLKIYVPAESVEAYKAANIWRSKASAIYPIT